MQVIDFYLNAKLHVITPSADYARQITDPEDLDLVNCHMQGSIFLEET